MKRYLFTHIVLLSAVVAGAASFIKPVNAEIYSVYDEKNVAQAIAMVGQLKQQVQQEMALYRSLSGARGFGALLDRPGGGRCAAGQLAERVCRDSRGRVYRVDWSGSGTARAKQALRL